MDSYLPLVDDFDALTSLAGLCAYVRRYALPCVVVSEGRSAETSAWEAGVTVTLVDPHVPDSTLAVLRLFLQGWAVAEIPIGFPGSVQRTSVLDDGAARASATRTTSSPTHDERSSSTAWASRAPETEEDETFERR